MRTVCLVTNYNYACYLKECLISLVSQTQRFDQIIIVDDGSSDDSLEIISRFCQDCNYATPIYKNNGGQLSCFNAALEFIKPDDFVFLMDSDDIYPTDYLEQVSLINAKNNAEYVIANPVRFKNNYQALTSACFRPGEVHAFSSTSALTRKIRCCIGLETSCISMRGSLLLALLPYPFEEDWRSCADDIFAIGSSIIGARKLYLESIGISYRIHGTNQFAGRQITPHEHAEWNLRRERLFKWYSDKAMLPLDPPLKSAIQEVLLIPRSVRRRFSIPSPAAMLLMDLVRYLSIVKLLLRCAKDHPHR